MSGAENQVQGGAIDALSTAMGLEIDVEEGRIQQTNFDDYPILRMRSAPPVEVHFIQSDFRPSGLGEPCVPPLAAGTGQRNLRRHRRKSAHHAIQASRLHNLDRPVLKRLPKNVAYGRARLQSLS